MRFVVLFKYGPNWKSGLTVYQQGKPMAHHLDSMRSRFDADEQMPSPSASVPADA